MDKKAQDMAESLADSDNRRKTFTECADKRDKATRKILDILNEFQSIDKIKILKSIRNLVVIKSL